MQEGIIEIETLEKKVPIDNSIEEYTKQVQEAMKQTKKALIKLNTKESKNINEGVNIDIDKQSPIYQALKLTPISELEYII